MRPLFLIGYRGTGKTSVAALLAAKLGLGWRDADVEFEKHFGTSIRQVFVEEGEAAFRTKESQMLASLAQLEDCVIATGGGVVLLEENRVQLRRGKVVWLTAPAGVLWQRLQNDPTTTDRRPNLAQGGEAEIKQMLQAREPLYRQCADLRIDSSLKTPEEIASEIAAWLRNEA